MENMEAIPLNKIFNIRSVSREVYCRIFAQTNYAYENFPNHCMALHIFRKREIQLIYAKNNKFQKTAYFLTEVIFQVSSYE